MSGVEIRKLIESVRVPVVAGAAAAIGGIILMIVLVALAEDIGEVNDPLRTGVWFWFNGQFVDLEFSVVGPNGESGEGEGIEQIGAALLDGITINYLTDSTLLGQSLSNNLPSVVYHAVPALGSLLAGGLVSRVNEQTELQQAALSGASIALGVLPIAVVGVVLSETTDGMTSIQPILSDAILYAGVLFPIIFGAVGGVLVKLADS
jgi:hypothetical protein